MILNFESFLNENENVTSIKEAVRLMSNQEKAFLCEYLLKKKIPVQGFDFRKHKYSTVHFNAFVETKIGVNGEMLSDPNIKERIEDNFFRIKFTNEHFSQSFGYPLDLLDRALVDNYDYTNFLQNFKTFYNSSRYGI